LFYIISVVSHPVFAHESSRPLTNSDLKCKAPCPACTEIYSTANKFLKHECFIKAPVDRQRKQLALFRREIEEEFNLRPRNHRKTRRSSSLRPVNSVVPMIPPPPRSAEAAVHGQVSNNAPLPYTPELLVSHESNHPDTSAGVYNNSQLFSNPFLPMSDAPSKTKLSRRTISSSLCIIKSRSSRTAALI
jgi:hypothetical protein